LYRADGINILDVVRCGRFRWNFALKVCDRISLLGKKKRPASRSEAGH